VACLGIVQFTIFGANLIVVPGLLWLALAIHEARKDGGSGLQARGSRVNIPAFFWPLVVLAAWTLVSSAFSLDPEESFRRSRQLLLFLIVPMSVRLLRGDRAMTAMNVIIALGAAGAVVGIIQYAALGFDDLNQRPRGTLGHYMTYSGLLMLVTCTAAARLIYYRGEWIWPAIAVPALLVALVFTESRNAWIGTMLAITVLLALRQVRLLLLVPAGAILFLVAAPPVAKERAWSVFDVQNATNRDRVAMLQSGADMVRDRPVFGVGLNLVPQVYPEYRSPLAVDPPDTVGVATRAHLHNVPMQLAAERGLPALAIWIWFVAVAGRDLFRQVRSGPARPAAAAGLAALIGMTAAGMFEHNFGDSEFLTLFLGIVSLGHAAAQGHTAVRPEPEA
jgi:O-antigen ligase